MSLLLLAPAAFAAPANDSFEDAKLLAGLLPIVEPATNVGATNEAGEFLGSFFAAGHSVWFEWEATSTGWVTVGSCEGELRPIVGVFTGTAVNALTRVASGNASEGPNCPSSEREFTFKAVAGTSYKIAVDGNAFYLPPAEPPSAEGEFTLRIEDRPPPLNDKFQDATALEGKISEEPGGDRFYYASAFGYNWGATKEAGEPNHGGDPGGASVWYSWTAPDTGVATLSGPCCGLLGLYGVYVGGSVDALTPVEPVPEFPLGRQFAVTAGTTYKIAVDGKFEAGAAAMGSFTVSASMQLPHLPAAEQSPPSQLGSLAKDATPPETTIHKRVLKRRPPIWIFSFESSEPGSTFRCKLDKRPFAKCGSGKRYGNLPPGRHALKAFAVDSAGNADPSPAVAHFTVPGGKKAHPRH
jgi:hypothetical protein